jgi:hypothetical protein
MYERIMPRIGAACGAVFVLLMFGLPMTGSDSAIVLVGELLGLLLFIPFLGYLCSVLREAEGRGGWLAATAFGAGLVNIAIKLGSIAPGNAADRFADGTATHQALDVMNSTAFIATMLPLGVLMAAVAVVIVRTRVLPHWLGWLAAVTAPLLLVNGMFLDAEFGPAFLLFLLWVLLTSVVLTVRPGDVGSASEPVRPFPTAASPA